MEKEIHTVDDRIRLKMNGFLIAVGCYVPSLTDIVMEAAKKLVQSKLT